MRTALEHQAWPVTFPGQGRAVGLRTLLMESLLWVL